MPSVNKFINYPTLHTQLQFDQFVNNSQLNSPNSENDGQKNKIQNQNQPSSRYKTELCRPFEEFSTCKYGDKCQFAHGQGELRSLNRHPKYKTELCRTFHTLGLCPYGHRCHFIHNSEEEIAIYQQHQLMLLQQQQQQHSTVPCPPPALVYNNFTNYRNNTSSSNSSSSSSGGSSPSHNHAHPQDQQQRNDLENTLLTHIRLPVFWNLST